MTVSMRKIQAGRGYDYLLKSVVRGDANMADPNPVTRYYTEEGTPPGRLDGLGAPRLRRRRDQARRHGDAAAAPAPDRRGTRPGHRREARAGRSRRSRRSSSAWPTARPS